MVEPIDDNEEFPIAVSVLALSSRFDGLYDTMRYGYG